MVPFAPVAFRPAVTLPTVRRQAPRKYPVLGQRFEDVLGWDGMTGDLLRTIFHTTTAVLGFHVWVNDKGFWKYFGLILGLGQTVGAICDIISVGKRLTGTHPPEVP
jgi:hypothetical protein